MTNDTRLCHSFSIGYQDGTLSLSFDRIDAFYRNMGPLVFMVGGILFFTAGCFAFWKAKQIVKLNEAQCRTTQEAYETLRNILVSRSPCRRRWSVS